MRKVICNTSPFQYLHGLGLVWLLERLAGTVHVPPAVLMELAEGRALGLDLPDPSSFPWVRVEPPKGRAVLPLVRDLGPGEREVLALALEADAPVVVVLDDLAARRVAQGLDIPVVGALGLLAQGKEAGLLPAVAPLLDRLDALGFRLSSVTRRAVLDLAKE